MIGVARRHLPEITQKRTMIDMNTVPASEAREQLYRLLDETARDHKPLLITGPSSNAVLVGEEDWNSMQDRKSVV